LAKAKGKNVSNRKLRIAVLGTRGIPEVMGGVETHCQALYPRLAEKGHRITLFARKGYVQDTPYTYQGVQIKPIWTPRKKSLEAICHTLLCILHIARYRDEFDLVHIHAIGPGLMVPLARVLGLKVVITHHGPDYCRQKWGMVAKLMLRLGEVLGCRRANKVITVSQHIKALVGKHCRGKVSYIPNGVPLPKILDAGEQLLKWGLVPKRYIFAVGRLVPEKGFHDLISAFSGLATDWPLVIAGDADHEDVYSKALKNQAGNTPRVVMVGFVKGIQLAELFSNAGLFVLPSYHEGLPIALLEALSYDLPVLASDIPANIELTHEKETFPVGNVSALKQTLLERISTAPLQFCFSLRRLRCIKWTRMFKKSNPP
jgi:starch synthase